MKNLQELETKTRKEHFQERRVRYRKWGLLVVVVLVGLSFGIGAYAGIFTRDDDGSKATYPVAHLGDVQSRDEAQEPVAPLAAKAAQNSKATREPADEPAPKVTSKTLDVLVLGVDRLPSAAEGSSSRSDTIMLAQVTPSTGDVELLSVPRDLYVEVEPGVMDRINTAYYGGIDQTRAVMEGLTGVQIDNYVIVDFEGFEKVIDAIGGVRVDVGSGVFPEQWNMGEGMEHLNGHKALKYARYRGTPRADLDRIDHQQKLLAALRRQALRWN